MTTKRFLDDCWTFLSSVFGLAGYCFLIYFIFRVIASVGRHIGFTWG